MDTSPALNASTSDQRSIVLELDRPGGYEAFRRIVSAADVFVTNLSTDTVSKLGLAYHDIVRERPDIIYAASTAFGSSGPYQSFRTWGMNLCAAAGIEDMVGWPDRDATGILMSFPDYPSALLTATTILAALRRRRQTGQGCRIELPQLNVSLNAIGPVLIDAAFEGTAHGRRGNRSAFGAPQGVYACRGDERHVAISAADELGWISLCTVAGLEGLAADARFATAEGRMQHHDELDASLAAWAAQHTDWEAAALLQESGVAAAPVFDHWDVLGDHQLASRDYFQLATSTRFGVDIVNRPGVFLPETAEPVTAAAPSMGEHSREILAEWGGLPGEQIDELLDEGIAMTAVCPELQLRRPYLDWIGRLVRVPWPTPGPAVATARAKSGR